MKYLSLILKRKLKSFNPNSLLSSGLLGLLLVIYIYTIYTLVITLGTFPFGRQPTISFLQPAEYWLLNLISLLCLALTIVPVGRWLQHHVNELVYAQDDDLYALPVLINQQLHGMQNRNLTLPQVVETIGTKLYLPFVAIVVDSDPNISYTFGARREQVAVAQYPICYLEQELARLLVSHRAAKRPFTDSDDAVLQECAKQIGIALYVAELTAVLQSSREQLIIAREEERRRIRNDLHDGLAPTLSSFQLQLGAIRKLISRDPALSETMIQELRDDLRLATADIRRLVYDLRPPMLDEFGLIAAIKNFRLSGTPLQLEVVAPEPMPTLPAAIEVAIYRIASEAIHNVVKHAQAATCTIHIAVETKTLTLSVTDDGEGLADSNRYGIGVQSMRERAAELGGTFSIEPNAELGTRIEVRLPLGG